MKHYPKCLYKTKEKTIIAKNENNHRELAAQGWLDKWTDKEPSQFEHLVKEDLERKKKLIVDLEELKAEVELEEKKELKKKDVKDGNGKNNSKRGPKAS